MAEYATLADPDPLIVAAREAIQRMRAAAALIALPEQRGELVASAARLELALTTRKTA